MQLVGAVQHLQVRPAGRRDGQDRAVHQRPVREDQAGRLGGDVRAEQEQRERRRRRERGEERESLAAAAGEPRRIRRTHQQVDEQPDERHRGREVRGHGRARVAEPDRLGPEVRLEPDEHERGDRRPQDRAPVSMVDHGQRGHPEDQEPDHGRHGPVDPFDPHVEARVEARQELAREAARPVRARLARVGRAHGDTDHDEHERGDDGRGSEPLEAGQRSSGWRSRILAVRAAPSFPIRGYAFDVIPGTRPRCRHARNDPGARRADRSGLLRRRRRNLERSWHRPARPRRPPARRPRPSPTTCRAGGRRPPRPPVVPLIIASPGELVCGKNRVLFTMIDASNAPIGAPDRTAKVAFYDLARDPNTPISTQDGTFVWAIENERGIYVANATFPEAGRYGAEFTTAAAGGAPATIRLTFDVQPTSAVVKVGDHAPASKTPTLADVGGDVTHISTDVDAGSRVLPDLGRPGARRPQAVRPGLRDAEVLHQRPVRPDPRPDQALRREVPERDLHQRRAIQAQARRGRAPGGPRREPAAPERRRRRTSGTCSASRTCSS